MRRVYPALRRLHRVLQRAVQPAVAPHVLLDSIGMAQVVLRIPLPAVLRLVLPVNIGMVRRV